MHVVDVTNDIIYIYHIRRPECSAYAWIPNSTKIVCGSLPKLTILDIPEYIHAKGISGIKSVDLEKETLKEVAPKENQSPTKIDLANYFNCDSIAASGDLNKITCNARELDNPDGNGNLLIIDKKAEKILVLQNVNLNVFQMTPDGNFLIFPLKNNLTLSLKDQFEKVDSTGKLSQNDSQNNIFYIGDLEKTLRLYSVGYSNNSFTNESIPYFYITSGIDLNLKTNAISDINVLKSGDGKNGISSMDISKLEFTEYDYDSSESFPSTIKLSLPKDILTPKRDPALVKDSRVDFWQFFDINQQEFGQISVFENYPQYYYINGDTVDEKELGGKKWRITESSGTAEYETRYKNYDIAASFHVIGGYKELDNNTKQLIEKIVSYIWVK